MSARQRESGEQVAPGPAWLKIDSCRSIALYTRTAQVLDKIVAAEDVSPMLLRVELDDGQLAWVATHSLARAAELAVTMRAPHVKLVCGDDEPAEELRGALEALLEQRGVVN
jgi:hypothetical protein